MEQSDLALALGVIGNALRSLDNVGSRAHKRKKRF